MGLSHSDVIERFAERRVNKRTGRVEWEGSRVFCEGAYVYSFRRSWPLAKYLGERGGKHVFLKNGDRISNSTSGHLSEVQSRCNGPTVSLSALHEAGILFSDLSFETIIDWAEDFRETVYHCKSNSKFYKQWDYKNREPKWDTVWTPPRQGMFVATGNDDDPDMREGYWHVLGAVLVKHKDNHFLCSVDEGRYFVSRLRRPAKTVDQAFAQLKPAPVRAAEKEGRLVTRQGEWFFVPTEQEYADFARSLGLSKTKLLDRAKPGPLPRQNPRSNQHVVRHFKVKGQTYAFGRVVHKDDRGERASGEHRSAKLGDVVHRVYRNTELESWSMGGRVD